MSISKMDVSTVEGNTSKKMDINKLMVVGHSMSSHEKILEALHMSGMRYAKLSKNEKLEASAISQTLLKGNACDYTLDESIKQLEVSPLWDGLALDLMLGNIDQDMWCWADSDAIALLEYWKKLDNKLGFVLVYGSPEDLIAHTFKHSEHIEESKVAETLHQWMRYNKALLHFYLRNQERAYLIHGSNAIQNTNECIEHVSKMLTLPLSSKNIALQNFSSNSKKENLFKHLSRELLYAYPEATELYQELQSVANKPFNDTAAPYLLKDAWASLASLNNEVEQQDEFINELILEIGTTQKEKEEALKKEQARLEELQKELKDVQEKKVAAVSEENELLLTQLHTVQEELERYYLEVQSKNSHAEQTTKQLQQLETKLTATQKEKEESLQKQKAELESKISLVQKEKEEALKKEQARLEELQKELRDVKEKKVVAVSEENELLLTQLHTVQEELERYYLETQKLKKEVESSKKPRYYGAAERIKQELNYRLGAEMIARSKSVSGWVYMPFALMGVYKHYRLDQKAKAGQKLPQISQYADAQEAQKVEKHLSYRLGATMIETMDSSFGIFKLPFALSKTIKTFQEERK